MDVDGDNELLTQAAAGVTLEKGVWPDLRTDIIARLDKISREEFPIPKLPPPRPLILPEVDNEGRLVSPLASSPPPTSSQEANKENAPAQRSAGPAAQELAPGQLPKQIEDMLSGIKAHLESFPAHPPHTIQRLAELVLRPRAHYKSLAPYLHAVDRVVMVTSAADTYPLPPPVVASLRPGAEGDPAESVAWSNPASSTLGTDEALGGALLTPIPWVTSNKLPTEPPASNGGGSSGAGGSASESAQGAQIHSESTEKIEGPNGMGSIETVSVSVNGIPSTGHARAITQGELLRQEQRAGVVPQNSLRLRDHSLGEAERRAGGAEEAGEERHGGGERPEDDADDEEEEEEIPHARGPEEIGVGDTGLQSTTTSYVGEGGLDTQGLDLEAAVGRKHDEDDQAGEKQGADQDSGAADGAGVKREADPELESEPAKKLKEGGTGEAEQRKADPEARDVKDDQMETED